jgi:hypothetical protein
VAYLLQPWHVDEDGVQAILALLKSVDTAPGPGGSRITPVPAALEAALRMAVNAGRFARAALVALHPSSQIVAHRDPPIPGVRYHVPLRANPGCWSLHDGVWQQLEVGLAYQMDPTLEHGAVNWGSTLRLHLMLDT